MTKPVIAKKTLELVDKASYEDDLGFRPHMGASIIGGECPRAIWYTFRWFTPTDVEPHIARLFRRGKAEEAVIFEYLRKAGIKVVEFDDKGNQIEVSDIHGHFGGSLDALAVGFPELGHETAVVEIKTHNDKSFTDLQKKGVKEAKPTHWAQMQVYMFHKEIEHAVYISVNKNNDKMHIEIVKSEPMIGRALTEKARKLIYNPEPPDRIADDPTFFSCKWCNHYSVCHQKLPVQIKNCRNCKYSTPHESGFWLCTKFDSMLSVDEQRAGCTKHEALT